MDCPITTVKSINLLYITEKLVTQVRLCLCGCVCILLEDIERHHDWYPKQVCYLDLLPQIAMATT